jgi:hypothetical protein
MSPHSCKYLRQLAALFIYVTRSIRLPAGQMILDIVGDLLADGRNSSISFLTTGSSVRSAVAERHRLVAQIAGEFHRAYRFQV